MSWSRIWWSCSWGRVSTNCKMSAEKPLVVLLGGSGYIGIHIMLQLHGSQQYQVAIVDKLPPNPEAIRVAEEGGLRVLFFEADLEKAEYPLMPRVPHCAIMLAALKNVGEGEVEPHRYIKTNIDLCVNSMFYLTKILGVTRLIQASSSSVYHTPGGQVGAMPVGVYGYTKRVTEDICACLLPPHSQLLIARYMNPIGSHRGLKLFADIGVCHKLSTTRGSTSGTFTNYGDCVRDYIHIDDLARFHTDALEAWDTTLFLAEERVVTLDVGTGTRTKVSQLLATFAYATETPPRVVLNDARQAFEGYDTVSVSDTVAVRIPRWWHSEKRALWDSLRDYI